MLCLLRFGTRTGPARAAFTFPFLHNPAARSRSHPPGLVTERSVGRKPRLLWAGLGVAIRVTQRLVAVAVQDEPVDVAHFLGSGSEGAGASGGWGVKPRDAEPPTPLPAGSRPDPRVEGSSHGARPPGPLHAMAARHHGGRGGCVGRPTLGRAPKPWSAPTRVSVGLLSHLFVEVSSIGREYISFQEFGWHRFEVVLEAVDVACHGAVRATAAAVVLEARRGTRRVEGGADQGGGGVRGARSGWGGGEGSGVSIIARAARARARVAAGSGVRG
jgi:hypothetical protein